MKRRAVRISRSRALRLSTELPGDKSCSHRAVMLASIAHGASTIRNFLDAADTWRTVGVFRRMGVSIQRSGKTTLRVQGRGLHGLKCPLRSLDCGNSGTTMRLLCGILAGQPFSSILVGDRSLSGRPMGRVVQPLAAMGAHIWSRTRQKTAPLHIQGKRMLHAIRYRLPVASAQVKSAILFAGLLAKGRTAVFERVKTRDHTERFFRLAKLNIETGPHRVMVTGGREPKAFSVRLAGDISSAAFLIAAAILTPGSRIRLRNVLWNSTRVGFIRVLRRMGACIRVSVRARSRPEATADLDIASSSLRATVIKNREVASLIDEFPILMVLATQARGSTSIHGAGELRVKETDRIRSMVSQLKRMGADAHAEGARVRIRGPVALRGCRVQSFGDHRTAMAFIVAGLIASGRTHVSDIECIQTSFPNFLTLLRKAGAPLHLSHR